MSCIASTARTVPSTGSAPPRMSAAGPPSSRGARRASRSSMARWRRGPHWSAIAARTAAARPSVGSGLGGCSDSRSGRSMPLPAPIFTVAGRAPAVELGERQGDEGVGERRRRRTGPASAGSPAPGSDSRARARRLPAAPGRWPRGRRGSRDRRSSSSVSRAEAVEDRPPGGLRLAPVEEAEVEEQPLPLRVEARAGQLGPERRGLGVLVGLVAAAVGRERRPGAGGPDRDQPVAQLLGRDAVDAVVVLDLGEDRVVAAPRASARRRRPSRRRSSPRRPARCR